MNKLNSILLTGLMLVNVSTSKAQTEPEAVAPFESVQECAQACVEVLEEAEIVMDQLKYVITIQEQQIRAQKNMMEEAEAELARRDKWYNKPETAGLLGIIIGVLAAGAVK